MRRILIAAVLLAGAAAPVSALAAGTYYLRNDTARPLSCSLRRPRSEVTDPVALRAGAEWSQTTERDDPRTLICYVGTRRTTFRMHSGQRYALREDERGGIWLRAIERH